MLEHLLLHVHLQLQVHVHMNIQKHVHVHMHLQLLFSVWALAWTVDTRDFLAQRGRPLLQNNGQGFVNRVNGMLYPRKEPRGSPTSAFSFRGIRCAHRKLRRLR